MAAINTVSGLMSLNASGAAWPAVGIQKRTTYGGVSGNATRPMGLRAVSAIGNALPGFPILGIGGIDSADSALQFIQCGASAVQICSAVQNQDFTLIDDYCTGLKALLYLDGKLQGWDGQSPPTFKHQKGKPVQSLYDNNGRKLPHFGQYQEEREKQLIKLHLESKVENSLEPHHEGRVCGYSNGTGNTKWNSAPSVQNVIGRALDKIGPYKKLDNAEQVVALIDDVGLNIIHLNLIFITKIVSGYVY